jgi:nucleosome assembly protein 1-like 1
MAGAAPEDFVPHGSSAIFHSILSSSRPSQMSSNVPISSSNITAPTPQNTPLSQAPIALGLSRPTVPDISEDNEQQDGSEDAEAGGELAGLEQHMLGMVHGKLSDLIGKSSGYIESLPIEVKLSVEALKGVQVKQNELHNKYKHECLELEKKVCTPSSEIIS